MLGRGQGPVPPMGHALRDQPIPAKGPIELQHHGNPIEFKNIYLKELK